MACRTTARRVSRSPMTRRDTGSGSFSASSPVKSDRSAEPISFLQKKFKPIGACSGYSIASLFLPGHLIPATLFNDFSSLPATYVPEFFKFLFTVRLLHKLGDADRRLTRQDRLFGHRLGRARGRPATPRKADDHCDDCPTNEAPNSILHLRCSLWLHWQDLLNRDFRYGAIPPLLGASTEQTIPSVNSFTLPDTLTAVLLAKPGACVTGEGGLRQDRLPAVCGGSSIGRTQSQKLASIQPTTIAGARIKSTAARRFRCSPFTISPPSVGAHPETSALSPLLRSPGRPA